MSIRRTRHGTSSAGSTACRDRRARGDATEHRAGKQQHVPLSIAACKVKKDHRGWFAALRRDRVLFAVAASLVLVTHLFQSLAAANAADTAKAWVICSMVGAEKAAPDGVAPPPSGADDHCPTCIGGPCAGMEAPPKLATASGSAFAGPEAYADLVYRSIETRNPPKLLSEPPPAIRAPPFAV